MPQANRPQTCPPTWQPIGPSLRKPHSLNRFFARLIWICAGPLVILASYLAIDRVLEVQADHERAASAMVSGLVNVLIDRDLTSRVGGLRMLAGFAAAGRFGPLAGGLPGGHRPSWTASAAT